MFVSRELVFCITSQCFLRLYKYTWKKMYVNNQKKISIVKVDKRIDMGR